ncbi:MAG: hypothetical protein AABW93_03655 [Nanoarchaeota archaeon]
MKIGRSGVAGLAIVVKPAEIKINNTMRKTIKTISAVIAAILLIDIFGFLLWIMSGQYPTDNFYIGTITAHILRAIL